MEVFQENLRNVKDVRFSSFWPYLLEFTFKATAFKPINDFCKVVFFTYRFRSLFQAIKDFSNLRSWKKANFWTQNFTVLHHFFSKLMVYLIMKKVVMIFFFTILLNFVNFLPELELFSVENWDFVGGAISWDWWK